jgi:hypothetical protein
MCSGISLLASGESSTLQGWLHITIGILHAIA